MKWIVGVIAALTMGLVGAPVAAGDHCAASDPACHEFDGLEPYFAAFERHGIGRLAGIPLIAEARGVCKGKTSWYEIQTVNTHMLGGRMLSNVEVQKVIEAANDVCPGVVMSQPMPLPPAGRYPDSSGAGANTGPLPHSDKAEIDLPPGSRLLPSNPVAVRTHSEHWSYDVSQSEMVAWLRQRLPVGRPFHGIAWCDAPQIDGQTAWEWISNGERFYVQVTDYSLVEFQRGSAALPCFH